MKNKFAKKHFAAIPILKLYNLLRETITRSRATFIWADICVCRLFIDCNTDSLVTANMFGYCNILLVTLMKHWYILMHSAISKYIHPCLSVC